jgi:hypothetical protein
LQKFCQLVVAAVLQSFPKSAVTSSISSVRLSHENCLEIWGNATSAAQTPGFQSAANEANDLGTHVVDSVRFSFFRVVFSPPTTI